MHDMGMFLSGGGDGDGDVPAKEDISCMQQGPSTDDTVQASVDVS